MQSKIPFMSVLSALLELSAGHIVHEDAPDGRYHVSIDASGNAIGTPTKLPDSPSKRFSNHLKRVAAPAPTPTNCPLFACTDFRCSGFDIIPADYKAAAAQLKTFCDEGGFVKAKSSYYEKSGNAIEFLCNYSDEPEQCTSCQVQTMNALTDATCGVAGAGGVYVSSVNWGAGRTEVNVPFC